MVLPQHRLRGSRGGRRCRASWIRSSLRRLAPGSHPLAVDGPQAADQRGITGGQEADRSVQQSPSRRRKEVTSAPVVGRGLAAGDLGSRWLWLRPQLPTMV